jgi:hypothetical protein
MSPENNKRVNHSDDNFDEYINNNREAIIKFTNTFINGSFEFWKFWTQPWMKQILTDYYKITRKEY